MKINRGLLLLLLSLLLLTPACNPSSMSHLLGSYPSPTPTSSPLPTATFTVAPSPTSFSSPTYTATPWATASPTSTSTPTASPTPAPRLGVTTMEITRGSTELPWIALTFDAGASGAPLPSILETLRQKDVHCTFFVTGILLRQERGPELVQEIVADGHELGNHSDTHPRFTELTDEEIGEELAAVEEWVMELTGQSTQPYFRPPYGNRDERVRRLVEENGYITVMWTYQVWDWVEDRTAESVYNSTVDPARNGAIVVMHVGAQETADALPQIIEELQAQGYRLVTLSELLAP